MSCQLSVASGINSFGLLVITKNEFGDPEKKIIKELNKFDVPFLTVHNKADIATLDYDFIEELKLKYTVILVPHSVQQASRTADYAAFFLHGMGSVCAKVH